MSSTVGVGHPSSSYGGLGPSSLGGSMHDSMDRSMGDGLQTVEKAPPTSSSEKKESVFHIFYQQIINFFFP